MSNDLARLFGNSSQVAQKTSVVRGKVVNKPANKDADLFVTIPSFDGGRQQWGPCAWAPSTAQPTVGEDCLVMFDENDVPWVMTLAPVGGDGFLDGGEPDSNYGGIPMISGGTV